MTILNEQNQDFNLTSERVRLWKSNMTYTKPSNIADLLSRNKIGGPETEIKTDDIQTPEIEENTGVDFPGQSFDIMETKTWKEVDRTTNNFHVNYDLLVVEIATDKSPFIFKYNKNPGVYGKCENCYQYNVLRSKCACNKV